MSRLGLLLSPLLLALVLASCDHGCTSLACPQGLIISLDASFVTGKTYELTLRVPAMLDPNVTFMKCTYVAGTADLRCQSTTSHRELTGQIVIESFESKQLSIEVSSEGAALLQKTFDVSFETAEPNGPGCGTCRHAFVTVSLP